MPSAAAYQLANRQQPMKRLFVLAAVGLPFLGIPFGIGMALFTDEVGWLWFCAAPLTLLFV